MKFGSKLKEKTSKTCLRCDTTQVIKLYKLTLMFLVM